MAECEGQLELPLWDGVEPCLCGEPSYRLHRCLWTEIVSGCREAMERPIDKEVLYGSLRG